MNLKTSILGIIALLIGSSAHAADTISLAGQWRFEIAKAGEEPVARDLSGCIRLPGTMDDAGLGPKNTKRPTLAGPYRLYDYAGPAWYQRDVEIPAAWAGKRIALTLERCRWVTTVWLDERRIGSQDSLIAPHVYDLGLGVAPGKHRLTICVNNTVKIDLGTFVSALFGGTWGNMNGIVGRIELAATPPVWIDDVQVYPRAAIKTALVKVRIGNATGRAGQGTLNVGSKSVTASWGPEGGQAEVEVDMGAAPLWDEFSPQLSRLTVRLGDDERVVSFGMRDFAARGTQFTLNGRPVFLRGTLECSVWPLTGYPPTDVPAWQRIFRILKSYGLNFIRFHSWCPPEAAFSAADREGVLIQAEGPQANVTAGNDPRRDAFIEAEFRRMVDTYGNHPSFCLMTLGNEYGGDDALLSRWVKMLIERDPRHLYSSASCAQVTANRQWTERADGRGVHGPDTQRDLHGVVASDARPIVGHEIGQWMYYPDFNEMKKYTGVMAVKNFEIIRDDLEKKHQLDLAPQYVEASGRFATLLYKEEIEVLLRTQGYAGFSLLDLHDYPTQGTALIGPLDPFWDSKGFIAPEEHRRYCGPMVPLVRLPKRVFTAAEPLEATAEMANYGPADLAAATPVWTIKDAEGRDVASGRLPAIDVPTGRVTALGTITASLAKAAVPGKLSLTLAPLRGTEVYNHWEIWVYPADVAPQPPAGVVVCQKWAEAKAALAEGKKVVYFANSANTAQTMRGHFLPVFWSPVWFPSQKPNTMGLLIDPRHPLLAQFPSESYSNWQWHGLMERSRLFILDDAPADYRPTLQVIDNFARNHKLGVVFEGRSGGGQLLVCGFDLPGMAKDSAARQFLASLYSYVGSAAFRPTAALSDDLLEALFVPHFKNKLMEIGAHIRADSAAPGYEAEQAIDGDPDTIWHTPWHDGAPGFPHHLTLELPQPLVLTGVTCLPRQDMQNGFIKEYRIEASDDGKTWRVLAHGRFARNQTLKTVRFARPARLRYLKLVALSGYEAGKPYASLAEISVVQGKD